MADDDDTPKVSPFSQTTPIGRQRLADAQRSMRAHAHPWDGKAIAGAVLVATARELILETSAGSLVLFDRIKQLHGATIAVGALVSVHPDGRHSVETAIERSR